jgi:hypothetical protein
MGGGAVDATVKIDGARRDDETEGAEHSDGGALVSEAAPCCTNWNDCGAGRNRGKGAGTAGNGGDDICTGIGGGGSRRGACTRHVFTEHDSFDDLGTGSTCMSPSACINASIMHCDGFGAREDPSVVIRGEKTSRGGRLGGAGGRTFCTCATLAGE